MRTLSIVIISIFVGELFAVDLDNGNIVSKTLDSIQQDSAEQPLLVSPSQSLLEDPKLVEPVRYNPLASMGLSAIFPGIGQLYCKRRVRGSLFMASGVITILVTKNFMDDYKYNLTKNINSWDSKITLFHDSLKLFILDSTLYEKHYNNFIDAQMGYDLARYRRRAGRYIAHQCAGWMIGIYLWNISDALGCSNFFSNNEPRKPAVAAWLSSIPYLGLGQIYNGSFTKAGFIWTTHTMLTYMAYNYNRLMNDCINKRHQVTNTESVTNDIKTKYIDDWDDEYKEAFRKRNTYLWYLVLFYFYGIFDAAVDAHLHDYQLKIRLKPDLEANKESVSLKMRVDF